MIEYLNTPVSSYVSKTSRYAKSKPIRIRYNDREYVTFETFKKERGIWPSARDKFTTITPAFEYRPDLMSFDLYGVPHFWWKLLEANNMTDIMEFKAGRNIRVPASLLA